MNAQLLPSSGKRGFTASCTASGHLFQITLASTPNSVLQEKSVTPQEEAQTILPDKGYAGFSKVTVEAIPADYANVSGVTATAEHVLEGERFVDSAGMRQEGAMVNRGTINASFDGISQSRYLIPEGYHDGHGSVSLDDSIETALAAL